MMDRDTFDAEHRRRVERQVEFLKRQNELARRHLYAGFAIAISATAVVISIAVAVLG